MGINYNNVNRSGARASRQRPKDIGPMATVPGLFEVGQIITHPAFGECKVIKSEPGINGKTVVEDDQMVKRKFVNSKLVEFVEVVDETQ